MPNSASTAALVALAAAVSCRANSDAKLETGCTAHAVPGLVVIVRDCATGAAVPAGGTLVSARGRVYVLADRSGHEGLDGVTGTLFNLAEERPDTYTVRVERAGYRTWERAGVAVTADECHVRTTDLTGLLQPSAADIPPR